jgi:hypothetical protein
MTTLEPGSGTGVLCDTGMHESLTSPLGGYKQSGLQNLPPSRGK